MKKKLYKSKEDKIFAGVLGGLGEYFEVDPTILRLLFILIAIMTAIVPAIIGYVIAAIVVPNKIDTVNEVPYTETEKK